MSALCASGATSADGEEDESSEAHVRTARKPMGLDESRPVANASSYRLASKKRRRRVILLAGRTMRRRAAWQLRHEKRPRAAGVFKNSGGVDGTRTRDPRRDRPVF